MKNKIKLSLLGLCIAVWLPTAIATAVPTGKQLVTYTPPVEVKQVKVVIKPAEKIKLNCDIIRPLASIYDWDVEMALKVATKESGCNPKNHNWTDKHRTCTGSWNVMNVGCVHYKKGEDINDTALNLKKAYKIYKDNGNSFKKWTTCKLIPGCK